MALDTSQAPYFDDYAEEKNYHKILFTPRRAVQTRELNQLQTMLQEQIKRFGNHTFENGSMVIPGEINYDLTYEYVKLTGVVYPDISDILETNIVTLTGLTSGVTATVTQHLDANGSDPVTFYLQYQSGGTTSTTSRFVNGETLSMTNQAGNVFSQAVVTGTGVGSSLTINSGIYFINGNFVRNEAQTVILSRYSQTPSVIAGFRLKETAVGWTSDETLLDNANGSTNFNGVGADRLRMQLLMEVHPIDEAFDLTDFIELISFREGVLQKKVRGVDYSVLEDTLARRTYDESGDYTVRPFGLAIREHLNNGSNNGLYPAPVGDSSKFVVGIEPGKAYVRGYEIENVATKYVEVDKARDISMLNNAAMNIPLGNFITVSSPNSVPRSNTFQTISFYSGIPSTPGAIPAGTMLGTARIRFAQPLGTGIGLKLFLFDVKNAAGNSDSGFVTSAQSVYSAGSPAFTAKIESELQDSLQYSLLYKLPVSNVKTLLDANGVSDSTISVMRQFTANTDSSGNVILSAGNNEVFAQPTVVNSVASYVVGGTPSVLPIAGISSLGGSPVGRTLTIAFGSGVASTTVVINTEVVKQIVLSKAKTLEQLTVTVSPVNNRYVLGRADGVSIISVFDTGGIDRTSSFEMVKNTTQEYYGVSYARVKSGLSVSAGAMTIKFSYFNHGTGDYFSADSYSSVAYENIPQESINGVATSLTDVIDFRPRISNDGTSFSGTGAVLNDIPFPSTLLRADIYYYMPRIDKVYVDFKGNFGVAKGVASLEPKDPKTPDNAMLLHRLLIPAYTGDIKQIGIDIINNRRYTMRDIGLLDQRISNLEYYTTLSMLETETASLQIVDSSTGLNRFKNGFVTDNFVDHSVGSSTATDYLCSISPELRTLRPEFSIDQVDMKYNLAMSTNTVLTGSLITLPYTEQLFLSQTQASTFLNVNPYAVYRWVGKLSLTPNSDTWYDTVYTAPDRTFAGSSSGSTWGSWNTQWTGTSASTVYNVGGTNVSGTDPNLGNNTPHGVVGTAVTTTTTTTAIVTPVVSTSTVVIDDRLISTAVIPYMRSKEVEFKATGLKPKSRMYAFFDAVDVNADCKPIGGTYGSSLISDSEGVLTGIFKIPNTENKRFRVGTKQFTLMDNPQFERETSLSYTDADFTSAGYLQTRTQTLLTTTHVSYVTSYQTNTAVTVVDWDPLAQSFAIEKTGGVFLTSIEVYFSSKDASVPVSIEVREMDNGSPSRSIAPYSKTLLKPSQVNVSKDASVPTKFTFDSPVYLQDGNEYCFVVMSNCNNYNVYIATMGEKIIGTQEYISKQPFIGVLFKSQNNFTWTEDQSSDMKFKIYSAKFQTNVAGSAVFKSGTPSPIILNTNPIVSASGSKLMTIRIPAHNLLVGSAFAISGVDVAPGMNITELNAVQRVVSVIDPDTVTFNVVTNANSTGSFGGSAVVAERNMMFNTAYPIFQELLFDGTRSQWTMGGTSGKSASGVETPYLNTQAIYIEPNANIDLQVPYLIPGASEKTINSPDTQDLTIVSNMITSLDNVSPVIDVNRCGLIGVSNRLNSPTSLSETQPNGGNSQARYITKIIGLKNAANSLKVYADVNKQQENNVQLFYRTGNTAEEVSGKNWSVLPTITGPVNTATVTFNEAEYGIDDVPLYSFFQVKIVMTSTSSSKVPMVQRLRAIALGT